MSRCWPRSSWRCWRPRVSPAPNRRPRFPARLFMDPPTQAELDAQAALLPAGVAPLIRGVVFYDQDGDGSPG